MVEVRETLEEIFAAKREANRSLSELRNGNGFSTNSPVLRPTQPISQTGRFDQEVHTGRKIHPSGKQNRVGQ